MFVLGVLACVVTCWGRVEVVSLSGANYVKELSRDATPWLVIFHGSSAIDLELLRGVKMVADMVDDRELHVGAVTCDATGDFCSDAFGMTRLPVLVLVHSGAWSVGTTYVYTVPRHEWTASNDLHVKYIRDFALGNYKQKFKETEPWRLRYNPEDAMSRFLWRIRSVGPSLNFQQIGELVELRKNAALVVVGVAFVVGFLVQRIVFALC